MKVTVVIPMFNEEAGVLACIDAISKVLSSLSIPSNIVAVDDGSRDRTYEALSWLAKEQQALLVACHERNLGVGEAIKTGFRHADGDIIVTLDSDLSYGADVIPRLIRIAMRGADVAVASPYARGGRVVGVSPLRILASRTVSLLYRLCAGIHLTCFTSMARAYSRNAAKAATLLRGRPGFESQAELLIELNNLGFAIAEVPAELVSRARGKSKLRISNVTLGHMQLLLRILIKRIGLRQER